MNMSTLPITLITATPGGGKTALAVSIIADAVKVGRPIFQMGIPDLTFPNTELPPVEQWTEQRVDAGTGESLPYFAFPQNALIIVDECQRVFRPRSSASKTPDYIAAFETVRHTGVTFILITQHPSFIDTHIRRLVGKHIHLRDVGALGRWYYEWPECGEVEKYNSAPIKKRFKLPKSSFSHYKSSSLHIKRKYTMPPSMILLSLCLLAIVYGGFRVFGSISEKVSPVSLANASVISDASLSSNSDISFPANSAISYADQFVPSLIGFPESAPIYDGIRQVVDFPRVVGAICKLGTCICYTQQGTNAGLTFEQCSTWLKDRPFDPYRPLELKPVKETSHNNFLDDRGLIAVEDRIEPRSSKKFK